MPRIAVLTSFSAPGIGSLLAQPNRGSVYDIVAVIGSEVKILEQETIETAGVPVILQPIERFHRDRNLSLRNLNAREEYDHDLAELLRRLGADWVVLAGYKYILTAPMLAAFPQRLIALHEGDLSVRDEDGRRPLASLHAVRDAILSGRDETRSSAFFVTRDVGEGPLFLLGTRYPVAALVRDARGWGDVEMVVRYAELHREWMLRGSWGEMLTRMAEIIAAGTMNVIGDVVWVDGVPGPCRIGEPPVACYEREAAIDPAVPASCPFVSR
ncbi:MAG TPA: formyltransferase family protein [Thermoanaerobaculia bacterium]|nr:formyltransferase family protein [Thermoanaerobaculia bacterium]